MECCFSLLCTTIQYLLQCDDLYSSTLRDHQFEQGCQLYYCPGITGSFHSFLPVNLTSYLLANSRGLESSTDWCNGLRTSDEKLKTKESYGEMIAPLLQVLSGYCTHRDSIRQAVQTMQGPQQETRGVSYFCWLDKFSLL